MSREQRRGARRPMQRTLKPPPDGVEFRRKRSLTGLPIFSPRPHFTLPQIPWTEYPSPGSQIMLNQQSSSFQDDAS
ncbi:unnamed protein product [Musa hybrid cultivar]